MPWRHIADAVAERAAQNGFRRVGVLGTRWLVESDVYPSRLERCNIECVRPSDTDRDAVHRIIMEDLVRGLSPPEAVTRLQQVIARLKGAGCDAVALACTEIPLVIGDANSPLPVLDSTRILAHAAIQVASLSE